MIKKIKEEIAMALRSNYIAQANYKSSLINGEIEKDLHWEGYLEGKIIALRGLLDFIEHEIIIE